MELKFRITGDLLREDERALKVGQARDDVLPPAPRFALDEQKAFLSVPCVPDPLDGLHHL
jgi:hypothetical protein